MPDRDDLPRWLVGSGAAVALIGTFLPWLSSGSVPRSSYELFELVERLGFSGDGPIAWVLRLWVFVPLLLVLSAVVQGVPRNDPWANRIRWVLPMVAVVYVGGIAGILRLAPEVALFRPRFGIWITLLGAATMVLGLVLGRHRRPELGDVSDTTPN